MQTLVIIGAGGFGKEAAWVASRMNAVSPRFDIAGFCDDRSGMTSHYGFPLLGTVEETAARIPGPVFFFCAIGSNANREKAVMRALAAGWRACPPLIDPGALLAPGVVVGAGSYIGAGVILSSDADIGAHVIVNQHSSVAHDAKVSDFAQICPGARINGACVIGRSAFVGSGAVLKQGIALGANAVLGAASFAHREVDASCTAVGNPARLIFKAPPHR